MVETMNGIGEGRVRMVTNEKVNAVANTKTHTKILDHMNEAQPSYESKLHTALLKVPHNFS